MQLMAITSAWLPVMMVVMLCSGASNVLLKEFMVMTEAPIAPFGPSLNFQHPIFWSFLMKAGMMLCLPFYCRRPEAPILVFVISCLLGLMTDILINMAYVAIAGSAIQMLRGGKVVFTAMLSISVLGRRLHRYQYVGAVLVVLGITLVGISSHVNPAARSGAGQGAERVLANWKAIGCCFVGEVTQSVLWVYQESVLKKYGIHPLQLVGLEGLIGVFMSGAVVGVASSLRVENLSTLLHQLTSSGPLLISVVCLLVSMALFNYAGVGVTKEGSAVTRSIIDVSRSVVIWAAELWLGWHTFSTSQFMGFSVLVFGALIYNRILTVPYLENDLEELPIVVKVA